MYEISGQSVYRYVIMYFTQYQTFLKDVFSADSDNVTKIVFCFSFSIFLHLYWQLMIFMKISLFKKLQYS